MNHGTTVVDLDIADFINTECEMWNGAFFAENPGSREAWRAGSSLTRFISWPQKRLRATGSTRATSTISVHSARQKSFFRHRDTFEGKRIVRHGLLEEGVRGEKLFLKVSPPLDFGPSSNPAQLPPDAREPGPSSFPIRFTRGKA